jgi:hypothetical protein
MNAIHPDLKNYEFFKLWKCNGAFHDKLCERVHFIKDASELRKVCKVLKKLYSFYKLYAVYAVMNFDINGTNKKVNI